jgi:hypothetical protein
MLGPDLRRVPIPLTNILEHQLDARLVVAKSFTASESRDLLSL